MAKITGICRLTIDVKVVLCKDLGPLVDRCTRSIEDSAKHVFGHGQLHAGTGEFDVRIPHIDTTGPFKHLYDSLLPRHFEDLTTTSRSIGQGQRDNLVERRELDVIENDKRTIDGRHCPVVEAWFDVVVLNGSLGVELKELAIRHLRHLECRSSNCLPL